MQINSSTNRFFIGREYEVSRLRSLLTLKIPSIVVIQGRRRIGKSRLIREFSKDRKFYEFSGLIPDKKTTAESQKQEFALQYQKQLGKKPKKSKDWSELFAELAEATKNQRCVILLDEISWMGSLDPNFVGKLKIAWDLYFSKNHGLILVFCGSVSFWIEDNILNNTAFFGRINLKLNLEELSLENSIKFLRAKKSNLSAAEILKILGIVGGIPRYLELIDTSLSAEDNIKNLCFQKDATLLEEYDRIFTDIFGIRSDTYEKIVKTLLPKKLSLEEIAKKLKLSKSTNLIDNLKVLKLSGFVEEDYTWDISNGKLSRFKQYRLKDNYLRFYLKYLSSNRPLIDKGVFKFQSLYQLPGLETIFGLQFENLIINNRKIIFKQLGINSEDVKYDGPYFQRATKRIKGCQIDYLVQTKRRNIYLCEIKFNRDPITKDIIKEVKQKFVAIRKPRNTTYRFILICAGEVNNSVYDADFFDKIITFEELATTS